MKTGEKRRYSNSGVSVLSRKGHYGKIIEEIDLFKSGLAMRAAGLVAFFNTINLKDNELENIILHFSGTNRTEFNEIVNELHNMEIVDLFEDSGIKISEQSMGNYLLYYVFAKQKLIILSDIIRICFPKYKQKLVYALNTISNIFYTEEVSDFLISEIRLMWDEYEAQGNSNFLEYIKTFYSVRELETLKYIDEYVNQLDEVFYDAAQIKFDQLNNNHHVDDIFLNILSGYIYSPNRKAAIELIIKYYKKRPEKFMEFYFCFTDRFGIDTNSYNYDYAVQQDVIDILLSETENFIEHNVTMLFIRVAQSYLNLVFHHTESNGNRGIIYYNIPIVCNDGSKEYRKKIWQALSVHYKKFEYKDIILKIIEHYRYGAIDYDTDMVLFDLENIYDFIRINLDLSCFKHCRIVKGIAHLSSSMPDDLKDYLNNPALNIYQLLEGERHLEEFDYDKERELKKIDIHNYFNGYSVDDARKLFDIFSEIQLDHTREIWEVNEGLSILFELFAIKKEIYPDIVSSLAPKRVWTMYLNMIR